MQLKSFSNRRATTLSLVLAFVLPSCGESPPDESTGGGGGGGQTTTASTSASTSMSNEGGGGGGTTSSTTTTVDPLGPWVAELTTVSGLTPVWGGIVAQASPKVSYLVGGVSGTSGPVIGSLVKVEQGATGVAATLVTEDLTPRYCGCALVDTTRNELVVVGGRGKGFTETKTAELVNLTTGEVSALDAGAAASHPVGCHAVFLADRDEGYVFGGVAQSAGFTTQIFRYDPEAHTFTLLDGVTGPAARYDAAFRYPADGGSVWLVGGMGVSGGAAKFYSDVWKFDPAAAMWTEVPTTGAKPPGRRLPWVAFAGDGGSLFMGYGSDSPQGASMLGDLFRLSLPMGEWSEIGLTGDFMPGKRGFAQWLPGPEGTAGIVNGGLTDLGLAKDVFVLKPPFTDGDFR